MFSRVLAAEFFKASHRLPLLFWGKVLVYAAGLLFSLTLVALSASLCALLESLTGFGPIAWQAGGGAPIGVLAALFGISWLELLLLGLVTGVLAVASRSVLIPAT